MSVLEDVKRRGLPESLRETIIVACEVWRFHEGKYQRLINIKPYYKFEVNFDLMSTKERQSTSDVSKIFSATKGVVNASWNFIKKVGGWIAIEVDNNILGVQIDVSSRFGTKIEMSFSDYNRLFYRLVRTNDLIFLWIDSFPNTLKQAVVGGGSVAQPLAISMLKKYYNAKKFKIDLDRVYISVKGSNYYSLARKRETPHFAGIVTVKNFHLAQTAQLRINGQDPARMFQHLKINYGFEGEETKITLDDYIDNSFWTQCSKAFERLIEDGLTTRFANLYYVNPETFFLYLVDVIFLESIGLTENVKKRKNLLCAVFDENLSQIIDGKGFVFRKNLEDNTFDLPIDDVRFTNRKTWAAAYALAQALTKPTSSKLGFTSERYNPDDFDLFTRPHLDVKSTTPSVIDFVLLWITNFLYNKEIVFERVRRSTWVKSNIYFNKGYIGTIITLLFTFSGRNISTNEIMYTGKDHLLFQDEIAEMNIFEVNKKANVSGCQIFDEFGDSGLAVCEINNPNIPPSTIAQYNIEPCVITGTDVILEKKTLQGEYLEMILQLEEVYTTLISDTTEDEENTTFAKIIQRLYSKGVPFSEFKLSFKLSRSLNNLLGVVNLFGSTDYYMDFTYLKGGSKENFKIKSEGMEIKDVITQFYNLFGNRNINSILEGIYSFSENDTVSPHLASTETIQIRNFFTVNGIKDFYNIYGTMMADCGLSPTKACEEFKKLLTYERSRDIGSLSTPMKTTDLKISIRDGKEMMLQMLFALLKLTLRTVMTIITNMESMAGRNGSLYLSAKPDIQMGDALILFEGRKGGLESLIRSKTFDVTDVEIKRKWVLMNKLLGGKTKFSSLSSWKGVERDFVSNNEGKIYFEDSFVDNKMNVSDLVRWYVYRHIYYIGNFGVTTGFMSKIYLADDPLIANIAFDEDNIITRQLANFLLRTGQIDYGNLSLRRAM